MLSTFPKERQWASPLETWGFVLNVPLATCVTLSKVFSFWVLTSSSRKSIWPLFSKFSVSSEIIISSSFFFSGMFLIESGEQFIVFKQRQSIHTNIENYSTVQSCQLFFNPYKSRDSRVVASPHLKGGNLVFCCW